MIFQSEDFYVDLVKNDDIDEIVDVYNSNKHFIVNHMDRNEVTREWMLEELKSMKEIGFCSCKIVEAVSGKIIGVLDFKIGEETYLSLLMIHGDYKSKGFGKIVYQAFEEHARSFGSKYVRIDVVTNYNQSVLNFWVKNGFTKVENVQLNWTGKNLFAVVMKKSTKSSL